MMGFSAIKIFLNNEYSRAIDVPITPNTTIDDVINYCKSSEDNACQLFELWKEKRRSIGNSEKPYVILQQWGSHAPHVKFLLQDLDVSTNELMKQGGHHNSIDLFNLGYISENNQVLSYSGEEMNLNELKEIAQKQQQQIDNQQQTMVGKEQKLRYLKQLLHQPKTLSSENEKLRKLRIIAEAQEEKLGKVKVLQEKLDMQKVENSTLTNELGNVQVMFGNKQKELATALTKVQELTNHLNELRQIKDFNNPSAVPSEGQGSDRELQLNKMAKDVIALQETKEEKQRLLQERRDHLGKCKAIELTLDRQIEELTGTLEQKKLNTGSSVVENGTAKNAASVSATRMHTIVAAVEPLVQQAESNVRGPQLKSAIVNGPASHRTSSLNRDTTDLSSWRNVLMNRSDRQAPHLPRQARSLTPHFGSQGHLTAQENKEFYNKSAPPPTTTRGPRPESAMARLHIDPSQIPKQDSFTAKVRPLMSKLPERPASVASPQPTSSPPNFYQLSTKSRSVDVPVSAQAAVPVSAPPAAGTNIFTYKQPPPFQSSTNKENDTSHSVPSPNLPSPPPYSPPETSTDASRDQPDSFPSERSFTVDIDALRRRFAHAPRPLKKRSSFTEPERAQGPIIPKLIYDKVYKKADIPFYRPSAPIAQPEQRATPPPSYEESKPATTPSSVNNSIEKSSSFDVKPDAVSYESNLTPKEFLKQQNLPIARFKAQKPSVGSLPPEQSPTSPLHAPSSRAAIPTSPLKAPSPAVIRTKGILRAPRSGSRLPGTRIRFDPFALLLDASLEGDFDLVQKIIAQVPDPSQPNDEGITALHNAVCACHFDLVRFLVHQGSDVNASDTDGWTPLHCSASCNNYPMSRFLVENGACVFASTLSDGETAADKCEEIDEGYLPCFEYLTAIQEKLGVVRQGQVYALFDYEALDDDELTFQDGDLMTILRRGDENESEWWWARIGDREGYIPRNLIGMWPRIKPNREGRD